MNPNMKLSLGPNFFYWPREATIAFYQEMAESAVDVIHVGEVVCSKRREMSPRDWLALAQDLKSSGKEIILSSLTLLEAASELGAMKRLCENTEFVIEANDMGAVHLLSKAGRPFHTGPSVNIYNTETLQLLADLGLRRWVLPVELGVAALSDLAPKVPAGVETEIFAFGRLPLAYSARCFTARANNVPKDRCDFRCLDYPDGQLLRTQEDQPFLTVNGIQTLSALTHSLAGELGELDRSKVDVLRLSPQSEHMLDIIEVFDGLRQENQNVDPLKLEQWMEVGPCSGYWHARPGYVATDHAATEVLDL